MSKTPFRHKEISTWEMWTPRQIFLASVTTVELKCMHMYDIKLQHDQPDDTSMYCDAKKSSIAEYTTLIHVVDSVC